MVKGSVLSMGVFIGASTKIIDRTTGETHMGKVPPYSVVVPGSLPGKTLTRWLSWTITLLHSNC